MKVLMVDVDGVLVHGRPQDGLPLFTFLERDLGLSPELLQKEFFKPHWSEIIVGREPLMPRLESVLSRIAPDISAEALAAYWFENDSRLDHAFLDALAHYRADGIRIFLATNQEHMRAKYLMEELGLATHVNGIFYSAALGHRKPAEAFYALATDKAEASAGDIVFIDDVEENIESARRFGWQAIHWTGEIALHDALVPFLARK
ncbi:HAD-IA family hydrolase [Rhizobium jaguaris]|uniref:HAD family hydrolase n=1 Tax=Rhizobium jaguaris TaxID=1312183 RepID=A0A387FRI1_9HYPH|nr:HAD-IA family hydrolase [Rhizobium jaguaris]AYG61249.1 HAD family hydrolase [Rhizobium jaguaris]